ncbi:MAG: hypothetical protein KAI81_04175, partial [Candidatus Marinimicrobia bacterium]|nr:hypothetical protein [Candidatus Neomarinimicrobiota bacterium]
MRIKKQYILKLLLQDFFVKNFIFLLFLLSFISNIYASNKTASVKFSKNAKHSTIAVICSPEKIESINLHGNYNIKPKKTGQLRGQNIHLFEINEQTLKLLPEDPTDKNEFNLSAELILYDDIETLSANLPQQIPASFARVLNHLNLTNEELNISTEPEHILIVAADSLLPALSEFMHWKKIQGFEITQISSEGKEHNPEALAEMIKEQTTNAWPPLAYVILVGDSSMIPTFPGKHYPDPSVKYRTDLPYACFDGENDVLADIFLSRIPASNAKEVKIISKKIIAMESASGSLDKLNKISFYSTEDETFHKFIEEQQGLINDNYCEPAGFESDFINGFEGGNTADIAKAFDEGKSILCYNGHGSSFGWNDYASMYFWNPSGLSENDTYPLILSMGCSAGDFTALPSENGKIKSLGQQFLDSENRGGSSFIGASFLTRWYEDIRFETDFFSYLFSDHESRQGEAMLTGRLAVWLAGESYGYGDYYQEIYHHFGDASQIFHNKPVKEFTAIVCPDNFTDVSNFINISVNDLGTENLSYSINDTSTIIHGNLQSGSNQINIEIFHNSDSLHLTIFHPNYRSFQKTIPLTGRLNLSGRVVSGEKTLENTIVRLRGEELITASSNSNGVFTLNNVLSGPLDLRISKAGYCILDTTIDASGMTANDTLQIKIKPGKANYKFGFEKDSEAFSFKGDWEWGMPDTGMYFSAPGQAAEGKKCVATTINGFYSPGSNSMLISPEIHLNYYENPTLF